MHCESGTTPETLLISVVVVLVLVGVVVSVVVVVASVVGFVADLAILGHGHYLALGHYHA